MICIFQLLVPSFEKRTGSDDMLVHEIDEDLRSRPSIDPADGIEAIFRGLGNQEIYENFCLIAVHSTLRWPKNIYITDIYKNPSRDSEELTQTKFVGQRFRGQIDQVVGKPVPIDTPVGGADIGAV